MKDNYDLEVANFLPERGGWAALAYKVISSEGSFFLKAYEKRRASTPKWTALIDHYVPITVWLMHNSRLKDRLPIPVLTQTGDYKCEDDDGIYLLYEYIEGETVGDKELTAEQVGELASMIAELHLHGEEIPVETKGIKETFAVPFLSQLRIVLDQAIDGLPHDVGEFLQSRTEQLKRMIVSVEKLSADLKKRNLKFSLCHTDLHHWNLMDSGGRLMLIDWEGLTLAPVEADLMFFMDKPYYHEFETIYRKNHNQFEVNHEVLRFYRNRRKLEDIWEFIEQLLIDRQDERNRAATIHHLFIELNDL